MFCLILISTFFTLVYPNCVDLQIEANFFVQEKFSYIVSTNIKVNENNYVSHTPIKIIGETTTTNDFKFLESKILINLKEQEKEAANNNNCSTTCPLMVLDNSSSTYFFNAHLRWSELTNPIFETIMVMAVIDHGMISMGKGQIIEHKKAYYANMKLHSNSDLKIEFTRRCRALKEIKLPPFVEPFCKLIVNKIIIKKEEELIVNATMKIHLSPYGIHGEMDSNNLIIPNETKYEYRYNDYKELTSIKFDEFANKFLFKFFLSSTQKDSEYFLYSMNVGKLVIRQNVTMMKEEVAFSKINNCGEIPKIYFHDGAIGESEFCCEKFYEKSFGIPTK